MASYTAAMLPSLLSRRIRVQPGALWVKGALGVAVNAVSCAFMLASIVIFTFPFALPVTRAYTNYPCVPFGGFTVICRVCYPVLRKAYERPQAIQVKDGAPEMRVGRGVEGGKAS